MFYDILHTVQDGSDSMLTTFLIMVYVISVALGIYVFDGRIDGVVDNPFVIILSILLGFVVTFGVIILFLESTYFFIAKRYPTTSKIKHFVGKQIVSVPMHLGRIKTTIYGTEHLPQDNRFLIYSNHTSELDISIIMCQLKEYPVAFLAKQAVGSYLSIGKWAEAIGCVMLNRENNRQGNDAISQVIHRVQSGSTMVVFPEGQITREIGGLLKFRRGSFKIALASGVPIVPITLVKEPSYYKKKWPQRKRMDLIIHPPLPFESFKDVTSKHLAEQVRTIIIQGFTSIKKKT